MANAAEGDRGSFFHAERSQKHSYLTLQKLSFLWTSFVVWLLRRTIFEFLPNYKILTQHKKNEHIRFLYTYISENWWTEHSVIWSRSKCCANRFVYCLSTQKQNRWMNKRTCGSGKKYLFQFVLPRLSWLVRRAYLVQYADDPISQDWIETRWLACLVWFHIRFTHSRYFWFRDLLLVLVPMPHFANALKLPQHFLLPHFLIWKANFKGSYLYVSL